MPDLVGSKRKSRSWMRSGYFLHPGVMNDCRPEARAGEFLRPRW